MKPIERAARALYAKRAMQTEQFYVRPRRTGVVASSWDRLPPSVQAIYFEEASAVLQALREPDAHMHKATLATVGTANPDDIWRAMIDAALASAQ